MCGIKHIFIINPKAGRDNISSRVRAYMETRTDLESLVFTTEYSGHETELTKRLCDIFDDEPIRLYACGGSGTLCRVLSGIPDLSGVELASLPCGMTNDYLKCFKGEAHAFGNLEALINGSCIDVDVMDFGLGRGLNSISSGFESRVAASVRDFSGLTVLGKTFPYNLAITQNLLRPIGYNYTVSIDGVNYDGKYGFVTCMNGTVYGGNLCPIPINCPTDGHFKMILFKMLSTGVLLKNISHYKKAELSKISNGLIVLDATEVTVRITGDHKHFFSVDGELFDLSQQDNSYTMKLLPKALKFVVPRGVTLKDNCEEGVSENGE